ncbi:MAG: AI-2E family transporter [Paludibacter sp.]|jgi:predicted PurR-regulated permease PerM|nr:AI-2E family transporter [Paludibacter sp.]
MLLKLPFYAKASLLCAGMYFLISMLYIGQGLLLPLIFGTVIAILLHPMVCFFERRKINRIIAILITLLLSVIVIAAIALFMYSQLSLFSKSWPLIIEKFTNLANQAIQWLPGFLDISDVKVNAWIAETKTELLDNSSSAIGQTLLSVGSSMVIIFLIPVYVFLILYYKPLLIDFIHRLFNAGRQNQVTVIISQTKSVVQRYLVGLVIEVVLVAILNSAGLLILGIDYAILIGILGALLNLIPYIGGLIAVAMPMMIALATKDSPWFVLYVIGVYYTVQLIDNNYIVPKIVASKVRINALVSIVVVLAGGALWGISGMFLSIPLTAIIKVICDHIEPLKPIGFLLGDTMPAIGLLKIKSSKKKTNQ